MSIFNSLEFDGVNSLDNDVYITGESVYDAPERDVEVVEIAGRNGNFLLDKGRWKNIEVTYHCGTFGQDQTEFGTKMRAFRNKLASKIGYMRLTDTYHPDEFRMGTFKSALEVDPVSYKRAGEFDVKFDCKPQRWLTEGEQEITVGEWGETETATGTTVRIENPNGNLKMKSLVVDIEPIQNLNGYDHPWAGGTGKNKLQNQATSQTINGVTWTVNSDGTVTANGTATASSYLTIWGGSSVAFEDAWEMTENMRLSCDSNAWTAPLSVNLYSSDGRNMAAQGSNVDIPAGRRIKQIRLYAPSGQTVSNVVFKPMLRASGTEADFEPYENICPISGHDSVDVHVSPTTTASDGTTYTTSLGRTVYGGTLDVVSGVLTVDRAMISAGGFSYTYNSGGYFYSGISNKANGNFNIMCDVYKTTTSTSTSGMGDFEIKGSPSGNNIFIKDSRYTNGADLKTALANAHFVYELATPQTYQLTPQQVELLAGTNNIWSDGDVTLEYGQAPDVIYNPTPYDASPLLMVEGYGVIGFNGYEVEIADGRIGNTVIMEAGSITTRQINYNVSFPTSSVFNTGDTITVNPFTFTFNGVTGNSYIDGSYKSVSLHSLTYVSDSLSGASSRVIEPSAQTSNRYCVAVDFPTVTFTVGTASEYQNDTVLSAVVRVAGEARTYNDQFLRVKVAYDGEKTITLHATHGASGERIALDVISFIWGMQGINGESTVSLLGHPTYIDCDLGDAYMIKDGSYISLNSYIDLGSNLPVLASGNNPVTKDSTITELKIVPRYWIL